MAHDSNNCIWAINSAGNVLSFDVKNKCWQELNHQHLAFKRISSSRDVLWAVGSDHQIYIYVIAGDLPLRVAVSTYENQRKYPFFGSYTSSLLPTDRPAWSDETGYLSLPKESFSLPSNSWKWESDWTIEDNLEGEPLNQEGWQYAVDFSLSWGPEETFSCWVRRRKWVRYRRYVALNQWALIDSIHGDHVAEPFVDVSVGGQDIPGSDQDQLIVWAVTVVGSVWIRQEVGRLNPEGSAWSKIEAPNEMSQISVGPTGLIWVLAWDGSAYARLGVTRDNVYGTHWVQVSSPGPDIRLGQVSVGVDAIWCITSQKKVLFRKGVRGHNSGHNDACATGSGWVEMVHEMSVLSVASNDQVWALGADGKTIYFRTGISYGELTGKSWRPVPSVILCKVDNGSKADHAPSPLKDSKLKSLSRSSIGSAESVNSLSSAFETALAEDSNSSFIWLNASSSAINTDTYWYIANMSTSLESYGSGSMLSSFSPSGSDSPACYSSLSQANARKDAWRQDIMSQFHERFSREMQDFCSSYTHAVEKGTWIKSGSCYIYPSGSRAKDVPILCHIELERQGVESGTESGMLTLSWGSPHPKKPNRLTINLAEITCVSIMTCDKIRYNTATHLVINLNHRSSHKEPIRLSFRSDADLNDWRSTLNVAIGSLHEVYSQGPGNAAVSWVLTPQNEVYIGVENEGGSGLIFFHLGGGHFKVLDAIHLGVAWGVGNDCVPWSFTGGYGGGIYKSMMNANLNVNPFSDSIELYCYENQRWNPAQGFCTTLLPTDRYAWSDEFGTRELTKDMVRLPSPQWLWTSDWNVDFKTPGGVDSEGWQYSTDFPFQYHRDRRLLLDQVRRRRWYRKCRLTTTGPWSEVSSTGIISISIYAPHNPSMSTSIFANDELCVFLWAVAANGEALCRDGVTPSTPKGNSWIHVPCEQPLKWISIGGASRENNSSSEEEPSAQLWAVAKDGSAFLRHSITEVNATGVPNWFHVEPPVNKCKHNLSMISVGGTGLVLAVDERKCLWSREEIVPTFPEGTHWRKVCEDEVLYVSTAKNGAGFWAIISDSKTKETYLAKRMGISKENKLGLSWKKIIVNAFDRISLIHSSSK